VRILLCLCSEVGYALRAMLFVVQRFHRAALKSAATYRPQNLVRTKVFSVITIIIVVIISICCFLRCIKPLCGAMRVLPWVPCYLLC
jgi:hypothetical protein